MACVLAVMQDASRYGGSLCKFANARRRVRDVALVMFLGLRGYNLTSRKIQDISRV